MTAPVQRDPRTCEVCGSSYAPRVRTQVICGGAACRRVRQAQRFARWYAENATKHVARIMTRKRALKGPTLDLAVGLLRDGAGGKVFVTPHALEQWRKRCEYQPAHWHDDADYKRSLGAVLREFDRAHRVKELSNGRVVLWRGPSPRRVRFLIDPAGHGRLPVLVTVLPGFGTNLP